MYKMSKTFELPEELMMLVQDFLHSRTRKDWRTCKKNEAKEIRKHLEEVRLLHKVKVHAIYEDGWAAHCILRELETWSMYGLRKVIREPPGWISRIEERPNPLLPEWYLHLYKWVIFGDPRWHWVDGEWILESF